MPCYNDGQYIQETIQSLKEQIWKDIELIIIDDGSDDAQTIQVLREIEYPRMQLMHTDHIGPAAARNRGIQAATGKYIFPLDADDLIEKEYISRAVQVMEKHPNMGIVYCHGDLFGEQTGKWDLPDYNFRTLLQDNIIFVTSLFRKADWEEVGGFCEELKAGMEDYDLWLSILGLGREVYQFPETYFHYRIKPVSRTTKFQQSDEAVQETYVQLYERHKDLILQHIDEYCIDLRRTMIDQLRQNRQKGIEIERLKQEIVELKREIASQSAEPKKDSKMKKIIQKLFGK
ncbi:MAG: glycosyltransferase family 2 protein [Clostridia bacterium]|nr:glycosyltransferase family 2 protein [Clostridia bacterium]